jgi:hypothetical protein
LRRGGSLGKGLSVVALAAIFLVVAGAGTGSTAIVCVRAPCPPPVELIPKDVRVSPRNLPSRTPAPIAFRGGARVSTAEGTHPPALREATLQVDRGVVIDAEGLPVCGGAVLDVIRDSDEVRRMCRAAIVGSGTAQIALALPPYAPITVKVKLLLINGGIDDATTTLYAYALVPIPAPRGVAATVRIGREPKGQFGWRVEIEIPPIAGGAGSLRAFKLNVKRSFVRAGTKTSFLSARCPRGKLEVGMPRAVFHNEAGVPGEAQTVLTGRLLVPCTPRP